MSRLDPFGLSGIAQRRTGLLGLSELEDRIEDLALLAVGLGEGDLAGDQLFEHLADLGVGEVDLVLIGGHDDLGERRCPGVGGRGLVDRRLLRRRQPGCRHGYLPGRRLGCRDRSPLSGVGVGHERRDGGLARCVANGGRRLDARGRVGLRRSGPVLGHHERAQRRLTGRRFAETVESLVEGLIEEAAGSLRRLGHLDEGVAALFRRGGGLTALAVGSAPDDEDDEQRDDDGRRHGDTDPLWADRCQDLSVHSRRPRNRCPFLSGERNPCLKRTGR